MGTVWLPWRSEIYSRGASNHLFEFLQLTGFDQGRAESEIREIGHNRVM